MHSGMPGMTHWLASLPMLSRLRWKSCSGFNSSEFLLRVTMIYVRLRDFFPNESHKVPDSEISSLPNRILYSNYTTTMVLWRHSPYWRAWEIHNGRYELFVALLKLGHSWMRDTTASFRIFRLISRDSTCLSVSFAGDIGLPRLCWSHHDKKLLTGKRYFISASRSWNRIAKLS